MYIYKRKNKSQTVYYLCKSFRDSYTGKNSSKIVERIGTEEELKKEHKNLDVWLKDYAKKKTKEKENFEINLNPDRKISKTKDRYFNGGYFALEKICYRLGLDKICKAAAKRSGYKGDLSKIFMAMIYDHIIFTDQENSFLPYSAALLEKVKVNKAEVLEAIKVLSENQEFIQAEIYKSAHKNINYDYSAIFNECSNYCYDINQISSSSIDVIQIDIFSDRNGIPLAYYTNKESKEIKDQIQGSLDALQGDIICFSDNLPSMFGTDKCKYVHNINIRILKPYLKDWILDRSNWNAWGTDEVFNLDDVEDLVFSDDVNPRQRGKLENIVFYKTCKVAKGDTEKTLIVGFNLLAKKEHRAIRNSRYEKIKKMIDKQLVKKYKQNPEEFGDFLDKFKKFLSNETIEDDFVYEFNSELIDKDLIFDGYFACLVDDSVDEFADVINNRIYSWLVDYMFQAMKREFRIIPKDFSKEDSINAHVLVSYTSLLVSKILMKYLKGKYRSEHIQAIMSDHDFIKIRGVGWIPAFESNSITDDLDKICGISTDYEIIPEDKMKEILNKLKR